MDEQEREPELSQSGAADHAHALSRPQEPGTPEFRILCGARTPDDIRRRFGWKTDKELSECYEIALEELARAKSNGDRADIVYWDALVDASVKEAVHRPNFGELTEWEEADGRREKRESIRRLNILARAREECFGQTRPTPPVRAKRNAARFSAARAGAGPCR